MKRFINRRTLSFFLYYSGILRLILLAMKWRGHGRPLILVGHRVLSQEIDGDNVDAVDRMALLSGHAITGREFEHRLRFIRRFRATGDPAELAQGKPSNEAFYLTLDDGYLDNKTVAGPILRKLHIKAVIFIIAELLRRSSLLPWWDIWGARSHRGGSVAPTVTEYLARCGAMKREFLGLDRHKIPLAYEEGEINRELYISESAARGLFADGVFYLANHSQSHANFTCLSPEEIVEEIEGGTAALRHLPGYLPLLAYPFGQYDNRVLAILKSRNDIVMAFATGNGTNNDRFTIRRVNLNIRPFCLFAAECAGIFHYRKNPKRHTSPAT